MTRDEILAFLASEFPQALAFGFELAEVGEEGVTLRFDPDPAHLRPGGTVSGPTLMTLADTAMYLSILARIGPVALAVTSSLEIHFLRKPDGGTITASCTVLKLGRRLAVGTVALRSGEDPRPVAHATVTYAIPR